MSQSGQIGASVSELEPETATKVKLSRWLVNNGLSVAWEQQNRFGYDVFHVDDVPEKPDLLIEDSNGYNLLVETKRDDSKSDTYDSLLQTHGYWLKSRTGAIEYTLNGEEVDIDGILAGNGHSRHGRLFESDYECRIGYDQFGRGRQQAVDRGELPQIEYSMTEEFTRIQWRVAKQADTDFNIGIGVLLSTALDWELPDPSPAVLWCKNGRQGWFSL